MKRSTDTSVADSFSSLADDQETGLSLSNGSRIAVVEHVHRQRAPHRYFPFGLSPGVYWKPHTQLFC